MRLVVQDLATQPIQQVDLEVQDLEVQDLPNQHRHLVVVLVLAGLEPRVTQQLQHLDSLDLDHQDFCRQIPATAAVCHLDKWETQINHHRLEQQPHNLLPLDLQQLSHLITNLHHSVKLTHQIHLLVQIQLQPPRQPTLPLHLDHLTIILQTLLVANLQQARHLGKHKHLLLHLVPAIKPNLHLERHQLKIQIWDLGQTIQHRLSRTPIRIRQLPTMPTHLDQHLRLHLPSRSYQLNLNPSHKLKPPVVLMLTFKRAHKMTPCLL